MALAAKPTLLINLTSGREDLHAVTMGLTTAMRIHEVGWPAIVYLNVHAPVIATREGPNEAVLAEERAVRELLVRVAASGVKVFVCPHCMQVAGIKAENLVPGMKLATMDALLEGAGTNIVSLSY